MGKKSRRRANHTDLSGTSVDSVDQNEISKSTSLLNLNNSFGQMSADKPGDVVTKNGKKFVALGNLYDEVFAGHGAAVERLLQSGVDPNRKDFTSANGHTPLMAACEHGRGEMMRDLLRARADPNLTYDTTGRATPLHNHVSSEQQTHFA